MPFTYSARTALVLGGSKGLGRAIAAEFAAVGMTVAVTSRERATAEAAAAEIGEDAIGLACDTGDLASVEALYRAVGERLGQIDVLVLNSGGPSPSEAQGLAPETWRQAFETMFLGPVTLADRVLPGMLERRFGRIVSIISTGVYEPIANLAVSNTIRPALVNWGKTLASEIAGRGVTVNAIAPGRILTGRVESLDKATAERTGQTLDAVREAARARIPAGRYGDPHEFAAAALYLASDQAGFVTGTLMRVDGGQSQSTF